MTVPALDAIHVCALDFAYHVGAENHREVVMVYELWRDDERLSMGVVPFVPSKHLELSDPELHCNVSETDEGFEIAVTAQRLARFVGLTLEGTGAVFSDNYFDLPSGRTMTVRLSALDGWTAERVRESLHVRSLVDSF